jgi:hypothetical protein
MKNELDITKMKSQPKCEFVYATGKQCKEDAIKDEQLTYRKHDYRFMCKNHNYYVRGEIKKMNENATNETLDNQLDIVNKQHQLTKLTTKNKAIEKIKTESLKEIYSYVESELTKFESLGTHKDIINRLSDYVDKNITGTDIVNVENLGKMLVLQEMKHKFFPVPVK